MVRVGLILICMILKAYTSWTGISESIPVAAQTEDTSFRWLQVSHSGSSFDNWGLDNVVIESF